jgi:hypothetical protein
MELALHQEAILDVLDLYVIPQWSIDLDNLIPSINIQFFDRYLTLKTQIMRFQMAQIYC